MVVLEVFLCPSAFVLGFSFPRFYSLIRTNRGIVYKNEKREFVTIASNKLPRRRNPLKSQVERAFACMSDHRDFINRQFARCTFPVASSRSFVRRVPLARRVSSAPVVCFIQRSSRKGLSMLLNRDAPSQRELSKFGLRLPSATFAAYRSLTSFAHANSILLVKNCQFLMGLFVRKVA